MIAIFSIFWSTRGWVVSAKDRLRSSMPFSWAPCSLLNPAFRVSIILSWDFPPSPRSIVFCNPDIPADKGERSISFGFSVERVDEILESRSESACRIIAGMSAIGWSLVTKSDKDAMTESIFLRYSRFLPTISSCKSCGSYVRLH